MTNDRFKQIGVSHLILLKGGKILLLRRFNTGYEDGKYSVVAGHIEENESARQTMIREAKEEAGIGIGVNNLEMVHIMHRNEGGNRLDLFFTAKEWAGEPKIMEPDKCDDLKWFDINDLPENVIPYIRQAIDCVLKGKVYSECGWK
jgi:ADP-ribose pyrophosphatase YjhB (NUDIX family)